MGKTIQQIGNSLENLINLETLNLEYRYDHPLGNSLKNLKTLEEVLVSLLNLLSANLIK